MNIRKGIFRTALIKGILLVGGISAVGLYYVRGVCEQTYILQKAYSSQVNAQASHSDRPPCHSVASSADKGTTHSEPAKSQGAKSHAGICCTTGEFSGGDSPSAEIKKARLVGKVSFDLLAPLLFRNVFSQEFRVDTQILRIASLPPPIFHNPSAVLRP